MTQQIHTYEQLGEAFHSYLLKHFDEDEAVSLIETAERAPEVFEHYFGKKYESIYEIQVAGEVEELRKKIQLEPILRNIDRREDPSYTETLRWYRNFVKTLTANATPIPVPGEYEAIEEEGPQRIVSESEHQRQKLSTIYLEGETGEAQGTVYRQRNMELRQACIDYFKSLHGGRIVCECCGFDFAKRYDINDEYIEVHHRFPFSHTEGEHIVDAIKDLVPLCANCHRMIHHGMGGRGNCMSLEELKKKLR